MSIKSKTHNHPMITLKLTLICLFFLFLIFLLLRSNFTTSSFISSSTSRTSNKDSQSQTNDYQTCNKIPPSLSTALLHYATSKITPQQTYQEISVTLRILQRKSPCNFLIFGLGYDSLMWASLNHGGRTVFLEEDLSWINQIQKKFPTLESKHVKYNTKLTEADRLFEVGSEHELCKVVGDPRTSKCELVMKGMPDEIYDVEWDLIMVDAPTGWHDATPGRMSAIYTAGLMGRNREEGETDVFVHDVNRPVEDRFSTGFLCQSYLTEQVGRIRHFTVPSHRVLSKPAFCP
ncbi:glucuronoxylan 4-O-methyltransferase 3-like [Impatiens glandulifera]|uniref:glucuronoxylan 4-O-methyltransferase 3-like n=1 Tax=Impatiens glandulifera TaxID=253017 RepID=UPI001FB050D8|nr:glucuronoxylan 4-O-methyltransferase 3-like [Impatiens glandulifera]